MTRSPIEKKEVFQDSESYLSNEFEAKLKKCSQGRILVKLIHRQTGTTTYELVKKKSGWKAFGLVLQLVCLILI
jgi:hypothetical protein